jgi:D-glycero-beta-D-manno-heptose-7-phosphate kinase
MLPKKDLIEALKKCHNKNVLVVGDLMLDEYHWCKVERISPEAPVPVCRVESTTLVPGGAANVVHNIKALDSMPFMQGVLGIDTSGDRLVEELHKMDISTKDILREKSKPTILKSRIVAHQQHVVRVDRECVKQVRMGIRNKMFNTIINHLDSMDALVISDYLKGTLPDRFTKRIIEAANKKNVKVIVDPKGDHYLKYKGAYVLTPNFHEFETISKKKITSEEQVLSEGLKLIKKLQLECLLVTRSEKGMTIITKNGQKLDIPTKAKEVYDITGAGDTVIGMLSIALAAGCSIEVAASLANYAAGVVVGKVGTSITNLQELEDILNK